jgi:hypothetical protein
MYPQHNSNKNKVLKNPQTEKNVIWKEESMNLKLGQLKLSNLRNKRKKKD